MNLGIERFKATKATGHYRTRRDGRRFPVGNGKADRLAQVIGVARP